jgi:hypothetical protein
MLMVSLLSDGKGMSGFRVWTGIMDKKETHYVPTQRTGDPV